MYKSDITKDASGGYYALVVCIEDDGYKRVLSSYKGRYFKTEKAAIKSTTNYINKIS